MNAEYLTHRHQMSDDQRIEIVYHLVGNRYNALESIKLQDFTTERRPIKSLESHTIT